MPRRFLDTNILLRYFTRDDEPKAERVLALLLRVQRGEEKVETSLPVIFETVYTLQRFYRVPRTQIQQLLSDVIRLRGVHLSGKDLVLRALTLYTAHTGLSIADAYNVVYMQARGIQEVYSWDTDFDKVEGLIRVEPHQEGH